MTCLHTFFRQIEGSAQNAKMHFSQEPFLHFSAASAAVQGLLLQGGALLSGGRSFAVAASRLLCSLPTLLSAARFHAKRSLRPLSVVVVVVVVCTINPLSPSPISLDNAALLEEPRGEKGRNGGAGERSTRARSIGNGRGKSRGEERRRGGN